MNNQDSAPINFLLIEFLIERLRTNYFLQSSEKRAGKIVDLIFAFRAEVGQAFPSFRPIFSIKIIKQTSPYNSLIGFSRFQVTPKSSVDRTARRGYGRVSGIGHVPQTCRKVMRNLRT